MRNPASPVGDDRLFLVAWQPQGRKGEKPEPISAADVAAGRRLL